jgi:hypothetical protein
MKNILIFAVSFAILGPICLAQTPKINWGEDPVNLEYNGSPGMITIKVPYNPLVSTQGKSGEWTKGLAGNGQIFDVDSVDFFSGKIITEGIAYICGNSVKFLEKDGLDRSKVILVVPVTKKEISTPEKPTASQKNKENSWSRNLGYGYNNYSYPFPVLPIYQRRIVARVGVIFSSPYPYHHYYGRSYNCGHRRR